MNSSMKIRRSMSKTTLPKPWFSAEKSQTESIPNFLKVLIVDSVGNRGIKNLEMINNLGHAVELAHDGITALRMAAVRRPDVMLLDTHHRDLDECDVLGHLLSDFPEQPPLIIGFASQTNILVRRQCVEVGMDMVLELPLKAEVIETVLLLECARLTVQTNVDSPTRRKRRRAHIPTKPVVDWAPEFNVNVV